MLTYKFVFLLLLVKIKNCHSLTIEESRKILGLHYQEVQNGAKINNVTNEDIEKKMGYVEDEKLIERTTITEEIEKEYENNVTILPEQIQEKDIKDNSKLQFSLSESLTPMSENVDTGMELMDGDGTETKEPDEKESPTIFEELFIDTLTQRLNKQKKKFFNTNFENLPVEESFETLSRLCYRFLQHYRYFCVNQIITPQNEMRCRGYRQDCSQFFRPKTPLERITEKYQSNIRLGYYKLNDMQKSMSPFIKNPGMTNISVSRILCDFLVLLLCATPLLIFHEFVKPYKRGFYCDDESIRYPYRPSTVTRQMLIVVGILIPTFLIFATEIFRYTAWERKCAHVFKSYSLKNHRVNRLFVRLYTFLGYFFLGVCFNQIMVDIAKYTIGRHRPHFMDVCKPNKGYDVCPQDHSYINDFTCTGNDKYLIHESQLSFYSGHSAFSFYGAWYTSLYLQARLYKPLHSRILLPVIQFALFGGASFVAYSRVSNYKHHWSDVLVGAIMGSAIGIFNAVCFAEVFKRREIPPCDVALLTNDIEMEEGRSTNVDQSKFVSGVNKGSHQFKPISQDNHMKERQDKINEHVPTFVNPNVPPLATTEA
uniref:AcidPPc domain-containing protein n=1 Tax=Parastrongyloides trichosuri TaxID=131310 RepID=A0A0N4ZDI3_PARTI